jgi:DNA invertase Pin-like site-specific DNA recombinase
MSRVVIYARVSSDSGRQDTGRQVGELQRIAERHGHEVVARFEDFKSGALPNSERQQLQECLEFCADEGKKVDCVMVTEVSRLGRDPYEMMEVVKFFHDHKVNLYFQDQNLAMFKRDGSENEIFTMMFAMYSQFARHEREAIKERLQSGYKKFRAAGGRVGRKKGCVKTKEQLAEQYKEVLKELRRGTSIARTAKFCDVSSSTVARLKKTFAIRTGCKTTSE